MTDAKKPNTFQTLNGTRLHVEVTMLTVKRVRDLCAVDVLDIFGANDQLGGYLGDNVRLMEVICAVVRPQLHDLGWSDDEFFAQLNGDTLARAADCLLDEVADFFREPRKGLVKMALTKARAATQVIEAQQMAAAEKALAALDSAMEPATTTSSASDSPASSASSPGHSASASSTSLRKAGSTKTGYTRRRS
jgi:hypothetical protein